MLDVSQWVVLLVFAAFVAQDTTAGPQIRFCEPIVAGPIAGWIAGDIGTGALIGISAQLYWIGTVPAGMSTFVDAGVATVVAAALGAATSQGGSNLIAAGVAFLCIAPLGLLGSLMTTKERRINDRIAAQVADSVPGPTRLGLWHMLGWANSGVRGVVVGAIGMLAGVPLVSYVAALVTPYVSPGLLWAGILGGGAGTALGTAVRNGRVRWAVLGFTVALGVAGVAMLVARMGAA